MSKTDANSINRVGREGSPHVRGSTLTNPVPLPAGPGSRNTHGFVAYHRTCGHPVAVHPDREQVRGLIDGLKGPIRFAFRIRLATAADVASAAQGVCCNMCRGLAR